MSKDELIPKDLPDSRELVREGLRIGGEFEVGRSAFLRHRDVRCESDWKRMQADKGVIQWNPIMGLSSVDEQVEARKQLWEWGNSKGIEMDRTLEISSMLNGLPPELRSKAPKGTSYVMEGPDDFIRIAESAPIQPCFDDNMICSPNSVANAVSCLKAGCNDVGTMSQFVWDYPYWHDDVAQTVEIVKALGIMASKRKDGATMMTYVGDGIPGQFLDHVSEVGYILLEKYIVDDLCGAAFASSLGGVHSYIPAKLATWLALDDVLKSDHNVVTFYQGNTLEPTEDLEANYGLVVSDFVPFALLERKYKTGAAYMPNPVTECLRVPNIQEIIDVHAACACALRKALEYEEAKMLDDSHINQLRMVIVHQGTQFFKNIKNGLPTLGVDINDPLQVILALRRLGGKKLEEMYHPGERDSTQPRGFVPFVPTDLIKQPMKDVDRTVEMVRLEGLGAAVKDRLFVVGSTDTHEYGLFVIQGALTAFGATVVESGVDLDPEQILDAAHEEGTPYIAVSTHNGLCLDWGKRLMEVAKQRNQDVKLFMGGRLNSILEGCAEPVDVGDHLTAIDIVPCGDVIDLFRAMANESR